MIQSESQRYRQRVDRLDELRAAKNAADRNLTQREIAELLATSQTQVHRMLQALERRGGTVEQDPEEIILRVFDDVAVVRVAKACMELQQNVSAGGRAVVVSAGPPGAGKTDVLDSLSLGGYRVIDPDAAKDMLLDEADRYDLLDYRYEHVLPDGGPVGLRELSAHVHILSTRVSDVVRRLALVWQRGRTSLSTVRCPGGR
nr:helix-turn-helix domain-containing protein [Arthrobacter roseus]